MGININDNGLMFSKKDLFKLIIPLMIDQTLALTVGLLDTVMVASAGEAAVSGVSIVESLNLLIINLFAALSTGGAVVAGQYLGKGDEENGRIAAKQLVMAALFFSLIITFFCVVFNRPILSFVFKGVETSVMGHAKAYFYVTALSFPFIALFNSAAALFRGMRNSKIAMVNAIIMNVINLIGNSIFILVLHWDAFGAGLATLIARMVAAVSMMVMLRNRNLAIHIRSYSLKDMNLSMIKRILKIGIPGGLENSLFQIGKVILASLVASLGTTAITANAVSGSIGGMAMIPGAAIGLALTAVIAQCVGAKEYEQANFYIKYLMKIAFIVIFAVNALIFIFRAPVLSLYNLTPETMNEAMRIITYHTITFCIFWALAFTLPNAFRAAGDVRYTMLVSIFSMGIFRIGFSYLFVSVIGVGVIGVWISMFIDWAVRGAFFAGRYLSGRWKNKSVV